MTQIAALFHDVGKCADATPHGHAEAGARACGDYLDGIGFDPDKRERIVRIVRLHVAHCRGEESSLEARIVSDADLLDETGAMTVLWDCMAAGAEAEPSYAIARDRIRAAMQRLHEKKPDAFHTPAGRRFFLDRRGFLATFVAHLDFELALTDSVSGDGP